MLSVGHSVGCSRTPDPKRLSAPAAPSAPLDRLSISYFIHVGYPYHIFITHAAKTETRKAPRFQQHVASVAGHLSTQTFSNFLRGSQFDLALPFLVRKPGATHQDFVPFLHPSLQKPSGVTVGSRTPAVPAVGLLVTPSVHPSVLRRSI